jgi:iron complex transport system ATP-binding protein
MIPLLQARGLGCSLAKRRILHDVSFSLGRGELVALVGENGSGKSTLLELLFGLRRPTTGEIQLDGLPVGAYSRKWLARRVAYLPQDTTLAFALPVEDVVAMGRHPHLSRFEPMTSRDRTLVTRALAATRTDHLVGRPVTTLSGGERHRVILARAMAQEAELLLLDEPTAHLDLGHQVEALRLLRGLIGQGRSALCAIHDLSLASRFADRILLLAEGRIVADGPPAAVLTEPHLETHLGVVAKVRPDRELGGLVVTPLHGKESSCC